MAQALRFPSLEFFQALQRRMNEQTDKYKKIGTMDFRLVLRIGAPPGAFRAEQYGFVFADYWCEEVRALGDPAAFGAECTIDGPYEAWKEMFENIVAHGRADTKHTLNRLILLERPLRATGDDQTAVDKVYRYQYSLQTFLEEAAALPVEFTTEGAAA